MIGAVAQGATDYYYYVTAGGAKIWVRPLM